MVPLRFTLTRSGRVCYRGHTDTFDIKGLDDKSQQWLNSWTLYCNTCHALTLDYGQFRAASRQKRLEGTTGFVTQVPLKLKIVPERGAP